MGLLKGSGDFVNRIETNSSVPTFTCYTNELPPAKRQDGLRGMENGLEFVRLGRLG